LSVPVVELVGVLGQPGQLAGEARPPRVHHPEDVGDHDVGGASGQQQLDDGGAGRARSGHHDPDVGDLLADHAQGVVEGGHHHDGGTVLVVVERAAYLLSDNN
jgi:hypothetical protein